MSGAPRFRPGGQRDLAPSGQGERARANVAALATLRTLQEEDRPASEAEQQVLARWSGWGALPLVFEVRPARPAFADDAAHARAVARWEALADVRAQVHELLDEGEIADARRNTLNAFYTDAGLVKAVWGAVRQLGFDGGRVLEPGSGSGNFIGFAPDTTGRPVAMTGVEVEGTTAAISRYLYPDAEIITGGLEEVALRDGALDLAIGNVPYGRYTRFDEVHNPDLQLSIHDHFTLKALHAVRPGGIVAVVTSRYTLDAENPAARERMYAIGDLVGAVRLPRQAHRATAGTDVVTDVLFLRRRADGEEPADAAWLSSTRRVLPGHQQPVAVNDYYTANPGHVLGELRTTVGRFGPEPTVNGSAVAAAEDLAAAAAGIAERAHATGLAMTPAKAELPAVPVVVPGMTDGALGLDEAGNPTVVDGWENVPVDIHPSQRDRLVALIRLKQHVNDLYEAEAATAVPGETPELARMRTTLRDAWRSYRAQHPPLTKPRQQRTFTPPEAKERADREGLKPVPEEWRQRTAFAWIEDDPDALLLFGLEEWDDQAGRGVEQDVLHARVLQPRQLPTTAGTAEDAVALAMEWDGGRLDIGRVASLLGVAEESAAVELAGAALAFRDPGQNGGWEPRTRYLSGNVRTKLAEARAAAEIDPAYGGNVAALEQVQPKDLVPADIRAKAGATWIPADVYTAFLRELGFADATVKHAGGTTWEVSGARQGDLARTEWGTGERPAGVLFQELLRQTDSTIRITYTDADGTTHVDADATEAAKEQARRLSEEFTDWVWADPDRAARLARLYNDQFNNLVLPEYNQAPLTLPGLVDGWHMRPHQNAAIRRIVNEPTALLAHVVGAGKTATMVAGAMELRRTGMANKPAMIVPNHMLKQFTADFRELYPNAKLLAITASDLSRKRRAQFMARIAGGEWDAVILTHKAFERIPLRPETQHRYLDSEMASLRSQLDVAKEAGMNDRTVKQIENSLANAEAKLTKQLDQTKDIGVCLEDTGIDYLFLDEAHEFKNLRTVSAIPGAGIDGSAKATKLHMVLEHLRENTSSGRVATLATGTPIANSVTEAYVLMRYLSPQILTDMGVDAFDNWAATFGEVVTSLEPDPKGDGYKEKARFSRFFNVPELMAAYRTFADVRMAEDLNLPTPAVRAGEDGQRGETIVIPPTPTQRAFIKALPRQRWVSEPGGILKALGEGLRGSLDMNLVTAIDPLQYRPPAGDGAEAGSKLPAAAEKITEIWRETKNIVYPVSKDDPTPQEIPGGLQVVFMDEGTPGSTARHGANLYADLRDMLAERGIPRSEIRFIHEAATDKKKEELFAAARDGRVKVLIGSTAKMGMGTNVQARAVALHHLSYPWKPAEMAQRDGRIERQGNLAMPGIAGTPDDVRLLYYITQGTFDEFRLTTLTRKARFIGQIQRRDFTTREIEDIGDEALNLGMLTALASGDQAVKQRADATADRARLTRLARTWDRQQDDRAAQLTALDAFLHEAEPSLEGMREALGSRVPTAGDAFAMTVGDHTFRARDTAATALGNRMVALARDQSLTPGQRVPVGRVGGQDFHAEVSFNAAGRRQLKLRFAFGHVVPVGHRDERAQWEATNITPDTGRGAIQSLERWLTKLADDIPRLESDVATVRGRREEIVENLRPKDDNPYRQQARSKEREERLLGKLIIANEKHTAIRERVEAAGEHATEEARAELAARAADADRLKQSIEAEHALQEQLRDSARAERHDNTSNRATPPEPTTGDRSAAPYAPPAAIPPSGEQGTGPQQPDTAVAQQSEPRSLPDGHGHGDRAGSADASRADDPSPAEGPRPDEPQQHADDAPPPEPGQQQAPEAADADRDLPQTQPPGGAPPGPEAAAQELAETAPEMVACAAILRYYEPLLQRHGLSGRQAADYISRPGYGHSYDPDNPLSDLVVQIGRAGERLAGVVPRSYRQTDIYEVGEERGRAGDQLMDLSVSLDAVRTGGGPVGSVDLAAILAAPPGSVIQLPPEPERRTQPTAGTVFIDIRHTREGTTVHGTARGDRQTHTALRDCGFRWSRRQSMWYLPRGADWADREDAVQGLRRSLEEAGTAHTLNAPDSPPIAAQPGGSPGDGQAPHPEPTTVAETEAGQPPQNGTTPRAPSAPTPQLPKPPDPEAAPAVTAADQLDLLSAIEETTAEPDAGPDAGQGTADTARAGDSPPGSEPDPSTGDPTPGQEPQQAVPRDPAAPDPDSAPGAAAATADEGTALGSRVITPDGPGTVMAAMDDAVLVRTEQSTRVWNNADLQWPDEATPVASERQRRNSEDLEQATTAEGIQLRSAPGHRLRDLDLEAGHGTVVDADGDVIGWVRARTGDDGRRYWWAQDAAGGPPDRMPFHENLPDTAGVPAIRAAGRIRSLPNDIPRRGPIAHSDAMREIKLTTAQVRELRQLTLDATDPAGRPVSPPEWVSNYRRYVMDATTMGALSDAARAAAITTGSATPGQRRRQKVLMNSAEKLAFEQYETGRRQATITPPGDLDPFALPYQPQRQAAEPAAEGNTATPALSEADQLRRFAARQWMNPAMGRRSSAALPDLLRALHEPDPDAAATLMGQWLARQVNGGGPAYTSEGVPGGAPGRIPFPFQTRAEEFTMPAAAVSMRWEDLPAWVATGVTPELHQEVVAADHTLQSSTDPDPDTTQALESAWQSVLENMTAPTDEALQQMRQRLGRLLADRHPVPHAPGHTYLAHGNLISVFAGDLRVAHGSRVGPNRWTVTPERPQSEDLPPAMHLTGGTEDAVFAAAAYHAAVYGPHAYRPEPDSQGRDPVWIVHNQTQTTAYGVADDDITARTILRGWQFQPGSDDSTWELPRGTENYRAVICEIVTKALTHAGRTIQTHSRQARIPRARHNPDAVPRQDEPGPTERAATTGQRTQAAEQATRPAQGASPHQPAPEAAMTDDTTGEDDALFTVEQPDLELTAQEPPPHDSDPGAEHQTTAPPRPDTHSSSDVPDGETPRSEPEPQLLAPGDAHENDPAVPPNTQAAPETTHQRSHPQPATVTDAGTGLPLWTGPDGREPASGTDITEAFRAVEDAWADTVPTDAGTVDDLREALEQQLRALQAEWDRTVPRPTPPPTTDTAGQNSTAAQAAQTVNTALQDAAAHTATLRTLPEWKRIQSLRDAACGLWARFTEKAGPWAKQLLADARVQGFWRTVSIRTCDRIAQWAQAGADRLRRTTAQPAAIPTAQALLNLSGASIAYSTPRPPSATAPGPDTKLAELRQMRTELAAAQAAAGSGRPPAGLAAAAANARSASASAPRTTSRTAEQAAHLRRSETEHRDHRPTR